ncbi:MAG: tetratricopeptide repeat protein, partial [Armatimonadetes bacterium]|nr:tetratricopeptide repeat protein [Armatimonadota bacterium]
NAAAQEADRFQIRVGIHLGDVEAVGDDLLGHGINVAARIEPLAAPGGISISEDVARQVRGKVQAEVVSQGKRSLKGIAEQMEIFSLVPTGSKPTAEPPAAKSLPKIAVLPFATPGGDPEQEFFGDGLAEEILWALAKVRSLRVVSRTSCFALKGASKRVGEIGQALGVDYVLEGSVRRAGNRVRIAVQFIRIADDQPVWSERFDRELEDIFAIQEEITQSVVDVLQIALSEAERGAIGSVPTNNLQAYDCYLKARLALESNMGASVALAQEAVALDPGFARAYAALASAAWRASHFLQGDGNDYPQIAKAAADRAVELDPELAESQLALANICALEGKLAEAESHLERANTLDPRSFEVQHFWATFCVNHGRTRESCDHFLRAAEIRADDYQSLLLAGERLLSLGDPRAKAVLEEGIARVRRRLSYDPSDARAYALGNGALAKLGQVDEARAFAERAHALDQSSTTLYNLACFYSDQGDKDKAIAMLEEAFDKGLRNTQWINNDPDMDPIRDDPRVQALMARMDVDSKVG